MRSNDIKSFERGNFYEMSEMRVGKRYSSSNYGDRDQNEAPRLYRLGDVDTSRLVYLRTCTYNSRYYKQQNKNQNTHPYRGNMPELREQVESLTILTEAAESNAVYAQPVHFFLCGRDKAVEQFKIIGIRRPVVNGNAFITVCRYFSKNISVLFVYNKHIQFFIF